MVFSGVALVLYSALRSTVLTFGAYSMSKIRISRSPAADTMVLFDEYGINLTENMLALCPVAIDVFQLKVGEVV